MAVIGGLGDRAASTIWSATESTLLFVGYQADTGPASARREVRIHGRIWPLRIVERLNIWNTEGPALMRWLGFMKEAREEFLQARGRIGRRAFEEDPGRQWLGNGTCRSISRRSSWISPVRVICSRTLSLSVPGVVYVASLQGPDRASGRGALTPLVDPGRALDQHPAELPNGARTTSPAWSAWRPHRTTVSKAAPGDSARLGREDVDTKMKLFDRPGLSPSCRPTHSGNLRSGRMMAALPAPALRIASSCRVARQYCRARPRGA